ncbi:MAG: RNA 2',3'-cyclic phosphodiesterase, partial [Candidatus Margulisiibacteriota bacterium]
WVPPDNFHITLKFLGAVKEDTLADLQNVLQALSVKFKPFELLLSEVGVFPDLSAPQVLWVGTRSAELEALAKEIDSALEPLGFQLEKRSFVGHVTLARLKRGRIKQSWFDEKMTSFVPQNIAVKKITLYQSTLVDKSPVYKVLKHFRFDRD